MTPLGLRRALLYRFPEFKDIKVVRTGWGKTTAYCQYRDAPINDQELQDWIRVRKVAGTTFDCVQVAVLPPDADEIARLRQTRLPRDVVEDAMVTANGLYDQFHLRWPGVVLALLGDHHMT